MLAVFSVSEVTLDSRRDRYASFSVRLGPPTQVLSNLDSDAFLASASATDSSDGGSGIGSFEETPYRKKQQRHHVDKEQQAEQILYMYTHTAGQQSPRHMGGRISTSSFRISRKKRQKRLNNGEKQRQK
jgi:hypothetical protein